MTLTRLPATGIGVGLQTMKQEGSAIARQDPFLVGLLRAVMLPDLFGPPLFRGLTIFRLYRGRVDQFFCNSGRGQDQRE